MTRSMPGGALRWSESRGEVWVLPALLVAAGGVLAATRSTVQVFNFFNSWASSNQGAWSAITFLGDGAVALALALLAARRLPRLLWAAVLAALLATAWVHGGKRAYDERRPLATLERSEVKVIGPELRYSSFPSGHAATVFTAAGVCILGLRLGMAWSLALVALAALVGI